MKVTFAGESICGMVRNRNEDQFFFATRNARPSMAVVADGIGGHQDGDVASFFCARKLLNAWQRRIHGVVDRESAVQFLKREISEISSELYSSNLQRHSGIMPMGTTVVVALFLPDEVVVAHVGDSRFYQFTQENSLVQITEDHTLLQKLKSQQNMDLLAKIPVAMMENVISRAVGTKSSVEIDFNFISRQKGARYLLCTDGVTKSMDIASLTQSLADGASPRTVVDAVMRKSLIGGAEDNVTVVVGIEE